jgi:hypothetical protein
MKRGRHRAHIDHRLWLFGSCLIAGDVAQYRHDSPAPSSM